MKAGAAVLSGRKARRSDATSRDMTFGEATFSVSVHAGNLMKRATSSGAICTPDRRSQVVDAEAAKIVVEVLQDAATG